MVLFFIYMIGLESFLKAIEGYMPNIINILMIIVVAFFANFITDKIYNFIRKHYGYKALFSKYTIKVMIYIIAVIFFLLNIPGIQSGIIQVFILVAGGLVAFSSSSIIANGMSGVLVKLLKHYKIGDIVEFQGVLGEVTELSLFHTEVQTQKRTLVTIPNSLVMSGKMTNYSELGAVISTKVSLGYDLPRPKVEKVLLKAAQNIGLEEAFVSITVTYEINGFLKDVKQITGMRSQLHKHVLDECNKANIEIVSPNFVNIRNVQKKKFISKYKVKESVSEVKDKAKHIERLVFEKAEKERRILKEKKKLEDKLRTLITKKENLEKALKQVTNKVIKKELKETYDQLKIKISSIESQLKLLVKKKGKK